jgi:hypothetical protein
MYCRNKIIIVLLILAGYCSSMDMRAQESSQLQYEKTYVKPVHFNEKEWTTLKKKLKIKDYPPKKKKTEKKKKSNWEFYLSPKARLIIKWTLFGILISALLFLILLLLGINPFKKTADKTKINIALEELEENLDTAAIDPHLYAAIKSKNFRLAIRLYYLMIIQKLALKNKISWKKYKTNKHYLYELRNKEEYAIVKELTTTYERSWFGEKDITENECDKINPAFVNFLQSIH